MNLWIQKLTITVHAVLMLTFPALLCGGLTDG